jgi:rhodanese-related sulfurtransferase
VPSVASCSKFGVERRRVNFLGALCGQSSYLEAMDHSPGFLKLVNEAKVRIKELTLEQARERLAKNAKAVLMDVREDEEWLKAHAAQAIHMGKGILERDLEKTYPDVNTEIIMYCGGGFRSALTADVAQKMGYRNVFSLMGGYKALVQAGWPMRSGDTLLA